MSILGGSLTCPKTYHEWMKSPELLELTASEPLTFDEEMEMQQLTFILLERPGSSPSSSHPFLTPDEVGKCRMVGDVNMFLPNGPHEEGECEIMIACRSNTASIALFESLGFGIVKVVEVWDEVEMRWGQTPGLHLPQLGSGDGEERADKRSAEGQDEDEGEDGEDQKDEAARRRKDTEWDLRVPEGRTGVYDPPL
ncbi:hypothetical protein JCM24511_02524 [Saitozyma sp. JCM 24511]|nr:hypothetical protein JCM24511_02524 [Saitozyma sp. JCM 24511]